MCVRAFITSNTTPANTALLWVCEQIAAVGVYGARKVLAFAKAMLKARKEAAEEGGEGGSAVATTNDDEKEEEEEEVRNAGNSYGYIVWL